MSGVVCLSVAYDRNPVSSINGAERVQQVFTKREGADIFTVRASSFAEMEHLGRGGGGGRFCCHEDFLLVNLLLRDRVNMRSTMSDLIIWDPPGTGKSMRNLRVLSNCLHVKIQGFGHRTGIRTLVNWKVSSFPAKMHSTDFGSCATWQIPGEAHNSSQGCSPLWSVRQAMPGQ